MITKNKNKKHIINISDTESNLSTKMEGGKTSMNQEELEAIAKCSHFHQLEKVPQMLCKYQLFNLQNYKVNNFGWHYCCQYGH